LRGGFLDDSSFGLRPEELLLEPAKLLLELKTLLSFPLRFPLRIEHEIDQLRVVGAGEIFATRHLLFLQHSASASKWDSIQKETKGSFREFLRFIPRRKDETTAFETLRVQRKAGSIPYEDLHIVGSTVDEDEETSRVRVFFGEYTLYQSQEPLE